MRLFIVPDTQVKKGVPTDHLKAAGRYIVKHKPDTIVVMGDWWDMESLSLYNSKKETEGQRILDDLECGNAAMVKFLQPLTNYNTKCQLQKKKQYKPRLVYITGNHCPQVRIPRFLESHPILAGFLKDDTTDFLEDLGFEVIPFLEILNIEGIRFAHYICNPHSLKGSPIGGQIDTMIKNAGWSFVMGHQQTYKTGKHFLSDGTQRLGIVAGSFYQHHESYMGVQGNNHWRGCLMLNEVANGSADVTEISLNYLLKKYT